MFSRMHGCALTRPEKKYGRRDHNVVQVQCHGVLVLAERPEGGGDLSAAPTARRVPPQRASSAGKLAMATVPSTEETWANVVLFCFVLFGFGFVLFFGARV